MFLALAIMLGHNVFPHHHHETDKELADHHHSDDHNHDHDSPMEGEDLEHLFSVFQHPGNGVSFLTSYEFSAESIGKIIPTDEEVSNSFYSSLYPLLIKQKSPPFRQVFRDFKYFLHTGLRAPPLHIV